MITTAVKKRVPQVIAWRRDIHRHPETAWTEFRTTSLVVEVMRALGLTIRMGTQSLHPDFRRGVPCAATLEKARCWAVACGACPALVASMGEGFTGLWAELDCRQSDDEIDPLLVVRVDMDALSLTELADEFHAPWRKGFASCAQGRMHACGHDAHTALGMALAALLVEFREQLRGRIRFLFQPAEEGTLGALAMLKADAVKDANYLLGVHVGLPAQKSRQVVCTATNFLATTKLDAFFSGRPAHSGLAPHEGRNALLAACAATLGIHALPRHGQGDTFMGVGALECSCPRNVVPDVVKLGLETRGATNGLNEWLENEVRRVIEHAAALWGCTAQIEVAGHAPHASGDMPLAKEIQNCARECAYFEDITLNMDLGASEDFSLLLREVQSHGGEGAYVLLGTPRPCGHHTAGFDFDEAVLGPGLELLTRTVLRLMAR